MPNALSKPFGLTARLAVTALLGGGLLAVSAPLAAAAAGADSAPARPVHRVDRLIEAPNDFAWP